MISPLPACLRSLLARLLCCDCLDPSHPSDLDPPIVSPTFPPPTPTTVGSGAASDPPPAFHQLLASFFGSLDHSCGVPTGSRVCGGRGQGSRTVLQHGALLCGGGHAAPPPKHEGAASVSGGLLRSCGGSFEAIESLFVIKKYSDNVEFNHFNFMFTNKFSKFNTKSYFFCFLHFFFFFLLKSRKLNGSEHRRFLFVQRGLNWKGQRSTRDPFSPDILNG